MDDILFSLTIGRTALVVIGLPFLLLVGAGVVMALRMRRRMKGMMRGDGCPCMVMLRGEGHPRD